MNNEKYVREVEYISLSIDGVLPYVFGRTIDCQKHELIGVILHDKVILMLCVLCIRRRLETNSC